MKRRPRQAAGKSNGIVKILIATNQAILLDGVRLLLEQQRYFKVVHVAADGANAVRLVKRSRPDVAILSTEMTGLNGIEAAQQIRTVSPSTRVLILSRHASPDFVCQALRAGADGYLLTQCCGGKEVVEAVLRVARGKSYVCARTSQLLIGEMRDLVRRLTTREREVLRLAVEGRSSARAASLLKLSAKTLESYRGRALRKLQIGNPPGPVLRRAYGASLARALCGCIS
jgi:two-component system, NarL family, response regulator DesR